MTIVVTEVQIAMMTELHPECCSCTTCHPWVTPMTTGGGRPWQTLHTCLAPGQSPPAGWKRAGQW